MGFSGSAPQENTAAAPAPAAAAPVAAAPAGPSGDVIAVIAAAIAAYDNAGANPVIGRLGGSTWGSYARVEAVIARKEMY
jgi:hypothetical protein